MDLAAQVAVEGQPDPVPAFAANRAVTHLNVVVAKVAVGPAGAAEGPHDDAVVTAGDLAVRNDDVLQVPAANVDAIVCDAADVYAVDDDVAEREVQLGSHRAVRARDREAPADQDAVALAGAQCGSRIDDGQRRAAADQAKVEVVVAREDLEHRPVLTVPVDDDRRPRGVDDQFDEDAGEVRCQLDRGRREDLRVEVDLVGQDGVCLLDRRPQRTLD